MTYLLIGVCVLLFMFACVGILGGLAWYADKLDKRFEQGRAKDEEHTI